MRVLVLSQYYPPEPDPKIHALGRDLTALGHRVRVVTGFPNYPQGRIYPGWRQALWKRTTLDGLEVIRVPLYPDHSRSAVKRSLNYLSFAASASVLGPFLSGPADAMWVYCAPLTAGIPAWWTGRWRGAPFVFNIHDMWPETVAATDIMRNARVVRWLEGLARFIYRSAAAITVVSPGYRRLLVAKGVPEEKVHFIPNWADEEIYRPIPRDEELAARHGLTGRFNVVYGGNLGAAQALDTLLEAAGLLRGLPDVQFVLIGAGVEEQRLRGRAAAMGGGNVRFIGWQPEPLMPSFFALADVVVMHLRRDPLFEITVPGKAYAYLACGRPILCAVAGDTADIVRDAGAGLTCPPEDPAALAAAVRELRAMPEAARRAMGESGHRAHLAKYSRAALVGRHEALLSEAARSRKR